MLEQIIYQLHQRKGQWPKICAATGLSYSWLCKLAQGQIDNPGIKKLELLDSYFRDAA